MAQSNQDAAAKSSTDEWLKYRYSMMEYQAEHLLAHKFRESTTKPELIEHYKKAYDYHMMMANRCKQLLQDIATTITTDLDKPKLCLLYTSPSPRDS